MTTEEQTEESSGKEFRAKLEASLAEAKALRELYASTFKYVRAEDLAGIQPTEFAAKAQEIEAARKAERETFAKEFLAERGLPAEDLETALQTLTQKSEPVDGGSAARVASLGQLGGQPISQRDPAEGKFGMDRVRAAL